MVRHISVLKKEVTDWFEGSPAGTVVDATFGAGGHSRVLLERFSNLKVFGIDRDSATLPTAQELKKEYPQRFDFAVRSFESLEGIDRPLVGVVADLGLSSDQLESDRGFSFQTDSPLDMRFDKSHGQTAAQFLNQASLSELTRVFTRYGEDRLAPQLAHKIVAARRLRPIRTTEDLVRLINTDRPSVLARLFQALRIQVNDELGCLRLGLEEFAEQLSSGAKIAVISFHSLEDAIVKEFFKTDPRIEAATKKPITPSFEEIKINPRSRSAKLRLARKR